MTIVLVTGLTGFIALHIAKTLLEAGHDVRGTVRSQAKGDRVLSLPALKAFGDQGKLTYVVVDDLVTGNHEEAVKGVDVVVHAASPVNVSNETSWEDHLNPAVKGAESVLGAAAKDPSVKQVIQCSSFASMCDWLIPLFLQDGVVYNEESWNPITPEQAENLSKGVSPELAPFVGGIRYCATKKFSELRAMEIAKEASYKLTILCPCTNLGPPLDTITPLSQGGLSVSSVTQLLTSSDAPVPPNALVNYVDVRDFALVVLKSMEKGIEGRFAVAAGHYDHQTMADRLRVLFPDLRDRIPIGKPGTGATLVGPKNTLDASKIKKALDFTFRPMDETLKDAVEGILEIEKMQSKA